MGGEVAGAARHRNDYPTDAPPDVCLPAATWIRGNVDRWSAHPAEAPDDELVQGAISDLRRMPPDQRQQAIDSDRFKNQFSPQERGLLNGISQLPLAPADGGQSDQGSEE